MLRHVYNALLRPATAAGRVQPLRAVIRCPVFFDVASLLLQLRDRRRVTRLKDDYVVADAHHRAAHDYNAGVTQAKTVTTTRRAEEYYQILAMPPRDLRSEKLLIIGPRNIAELLIAWLHGFSWANISGLDLYSTNPKILRGNMEAMRFTDASFDAVAMSATLGYAKDVFATLREVYRVLRPGGRFAFNAVHDPGNTEWLADIQSGSQIKSALDRLGFEIYYYRPVAKRNSHGRLQVSHRFGVRKPHPDDVIFDRLKL